AWPAQGHSAACLPATDCESDFRREEAPGARASGYGAANPVVGERARRRVAVEIRSRLSRPFRRQARRDDPASARQPERIQYIELRALAPGRGSDDRNVAVVLAAGRP